MGGEKVAARVVFEPATHTYRYGDKILTSVTQALKGAGLIEYDGVAPEALEFARQRGRAVHTATQLLDEGRLDWESLDLRIVGYVAAYEKFKIDSAIFINGIEQMYADPLCGVAGTIDRDVTLNGRRGVLDIKTYEIEDWTALQLAGYERMMRGTGEPRLDRWGLWLKEDGSYKIRQFKDATDERVFLAALAVTNWKLSHNGGKPSWER